MGDHFGDQQEREQHARANRVAFERDGAGKPNTGTLAPCYVNAVHPDTGLNVTFCPGELLPDWAAEPVNAGHGEFADEDERVFVVEQESLPAKRKESSRGTRSRSR